MATFPRKAVSHFNEPVGTMYIRLPQVVSLHRILMHARLTPRPVSSELYEGVCEPESGDPRLTCCNRTGMVGTTKQMQTAISFCLMFKPHKTYLLLTPLLQLLVESAPVR